MQDTGALPAELGNLSSLVEYFDVKKLEAHTAKDDVIMCLGVYKKMKSIFKKSTTNVGDNFDLLDIIEE